MSLACLVKNKDGRAFETKRTCHVFRNAFDEPLKRHLPEDRTGASLKSPNLFQCNGSRAKRNKLLFCGHDSLENGVMKSLNVFLCLFFCSRAPAVGRLYLSDRRRVSYTPENAGFGAFMDFSAVRSVGTRRGCPTRVLVCA